MVTFLNDRVRAIATDLAPAPAGHYSQGMVSGDHLYVSGQLPVRPDGSLCPDDDFDEQATQALANMLAIVAAAGGTPAYILKVTAYIVGVGNWPRFNAVYAQIMGDARPARTVVPVTELHHGFLVEVDAVAVLATVPSTSASTEPGADR